MKRKKKTIRLGCSNGCFRSDYDGITPAKLRQLRSKAGGWTDVHRVQAYAQSIKVYDDPADVPKGYSVLDWEAHKGTCPECKD